MTTTNEYAIEIKTVPFAGSPEVHVTVYRVAEEGTHPLNPRHDGEFSGIGAPKKIDGLLLSCIRARTYTPDTKWHKGPILCEDVSLNIGYGSLYSADLRTAKQMVKTLGKIERQIARDKAETPDMRLRSFCKALGITKFVRQEGGDSSWLPECQWSFHDIEVGIDEFCKQVAENVHKANERPLAA